MYEYALTTRKKYRDEWEKSGEMKKNAFSFQQANSKIP